MNKEQQIEEMLKIMCEEYGKQCNDCIVETCSNKVISERLFENGYRKIPEDNIREAENNSLKRVDEFAECRNCSAWSGSDCTRHPYTQGCLKDENSIKRQAVKEFAEKLKEGLCVFFDENENNDGSIDKGILLVDIIGVEAKNGDTISIGMIDDLLKEYEND